MTKLRVNGRARSSASLLYALGIAAFVSTGTVFAVEWPALGPLGPVKAEISFFSTGPPATKISSDSFWFPAARRRMS